MGKKKKTDSGAAKAGKKERKAAKKAEKQARKLAPREVKTGKGMTPMEVGAKLVEMFNQGKYAEIEDMFWSPKITSVEGHGVSLAWEGRKAVEAKNKGWLEQNKILGGRADGPFVGASGFAVRYTIDVEELPSGQKKTMNEVGVYTIKNGKIVREEFMYGA